MYEKATSGRDAFTFSLHGLTTIASFTAAPAIAHDQLNNAIARRLTGMSEKRPNAARQFEELLARYFAPGRRQPA